MILWKVWWRPLIFAGCLALVSWLSCQVGVQLGRHFVTASEASTEPDLFRFDSFYYREIAERGYSYNGNPDSSPNIVFAPLFPWMAEGLSAVTDFSVTTAGFLINKICFWLAMAVLFRVLAVNGGERAALLQLGAMGLATGSYAFHAFYSESVMLLMLAGVLFGLKQETRVGLAVSTALLGLCRLALAPVIALLALNFTARAIQRRSPGDFVLAILSASGLAGFLIFLATRYGNPLFVLPQIQSVSWGRFHQPAVGWWWGGPLWDYTSSALTRAFWDIRTLNLIWTWAALASCVYALTSFGRTRFAWVFTVYVVFVYCQIAGSEFLISAHRLFIFVLPIYMMFGALHSRLARWSSLLAWGVSAPLLILNFTSGLFVVAHFNQGVWPYF